MFKEFNSLLNKNFKFKMNELEFSLTSYVEQILLEIKPDNVPSVIVYPDGDELNTMLLPYIALFSRYKNFSGNVNDLTENLMIDEHVYYNGMLGKFKGKKLYKEWGPFTDYLTEELRNSQATKLEFAHGAIEYIIESDFYKITRYKGGASRLNNIGKRSSNTRTNEIIEQFELIKSTVSTLIDTSVLYIKNKSDTDNIINSMTVDYGSIKEERLSKVVPLSYWTSSDKRINYTGNKQGLAPVVDITCNLESAIDLLYDKKGIELVIIDLADFRSLDLNLLEQVMELTDEVEFMILLPFNQYKYFNNYFNGYKYFEIVVTKDMAMNYMQDTSKHLIQVNQQRIFENYINRNIKFKTLEENKAVNFGKVYAELKALLSGTSSDQKISDLVSRSFSLLSSLKSFMDFNTSNSDESSYYIKEQLGVIQSEIGVILEDNVFFSDEKLQLLLEMLKNLVKEVSSLNKIAEEVKKILKYSSDKKILFIVQNNRIKSILDSYTNGRFREKIIHCKTISKVQNDIFYDTTYVLGVVPNEKLSPKLFSIMVSPKIEFWYYDSYMGYIKYLYKNNVLSLLDKECVHNFKTDKNLTYDEKKQDDYNIISGLTQLVREYHHRDAFRMYFSSNDIKGNIKCDYLINFNEFIGVFKRDYKVYRVNLYEKCLDYVKISNLAVGDEIIILNEKFKSGAFIDEIIEALLHNLEFYNKYNEMIELSKVWKKVLIEYLSQNDLTISELHKYLQGKGLKKTYTTFRNWITNDYIVGPDEEGDYKLILSLSKDLYSNWEDVYHACTNVRSLHIKLRHDIGKMIVESYFDNGVISQNLCYLNIDFMNKVTICEVERVDKGDFKVANYMVNTFKKKGD